MNEKIGVFDSGLGGLSVLKELRNTLPNEDYLFYEDSIHVPYGEKNDDVLFEITSKIVDTLLKEKCKIIVIACNTATTACMKRLREAYPNTIFVGTVPAIKVAYDHHSKDTVILSTPYTTKSKRVQELVRDYHREDQKIHLVSGENLASLIEQGNREEILSVLRRVLAPYKETCDSIVLGCTHYSLIRKEIAEVVPNVDLLDGCVGISQEVKRQLESHHLLTEKTTYGDLTIINTKDDALIQRSFELLDQES